MLFKLFPACLGVLMPAFVFELLDAPFKIRQSCVTAWIVET
jgi:hypothetical protein